MALLAETVYNTSKKKKKMPKPVKDKNREKESLCHEYMYTCISFCAISSDDETFYRINHPFDYY